MGAATEREPSSAELTVDLIISLDGCASADGWPGWWGPEYLAWLEEEGQKDRTYLLGANTYRLMSGMSDLTWLICLVREFWVPDGVENGLLLGGDVGCECLGDAVDGDGR